MLAANCDSAPEMPPAGRCSTGSVIDPRLGYACSSATAYDQADQKTDCSADPDGLPRVVPHVFVGCARGRLGAVDRIVLQIREAELGGAELCFDLCPQVARFVPGFLGRLLEQTVGLGEDVGEILDERFAAALESCSCHVHLLGEGETSGPLIFKSLSNRVNDAQTGPDSTLGVL